MNNIILEPKFTQHLHWQGVVSFSLQRLLKTVAAVVLVLSTASIATAVQASETAPMAPIVIKGAFQSEPVIAAVFSGDVRSLPTLPAWKQGDTVREIPRIQHPRPAAAKTGENRGGEHPGGSAAPVIDTLPGNQQNVAAGLIV